MPSEENAAAKPLRSHSFDAGAAWAHLALQATMLGYQTHAMGGVHFDMAREQLAIPDRYHIEIALAIGRQAAPSTLPKQLQNRESPSQRLAIREIAFAGTFPPPQDSTY